MTMEIRSRKRILTMDSKSGCDQLLEQNKTGDQSQTSEPSTGTWGLPDALTCEILLRLSMKTLLEVRFVSKSWFSLISEPEFTKTHLKRSFEHIPLKFIYCRDTYSDSYHLQQFSLSSVLMMENEQIDPTKIDFPMMMSNVLGSMKVLGSCDGLLCVIIDKQDIFLWNPYIRKSKKLPCSGFIPVLRYLNHVHGYLNRVLYGFGYDKLNDDYKVVQIFIFERGIEGNGYSTVVKVYSQKTNSWRTIEGYEVDLDSLIGSGVFANGKLYWAEKSSMHVVSKIVSFDLANETFGLVERPKMCSKGWKLGVLGGWLCIVDKECTDPHNGFALETVWRLDVWIMEYDVAQNWTKLRSVGISNGPIRNVCNVSYAPVYISKNGEILLNCGSTLILNSPEWEETEFREISIEKCNYSTIDVYVESLILP